MLKQGWRERMKGRWAGPIIAVLFAVLLLQCNFGTKLVVPSWYITLTIPLVSDSYPLDNLVSGDTTGTIRVYADSVDTNSDGSYDILLPDSLSGYPGGLYIGLENDLPPIRLPDNLFIIPGQDPTTLGIGPIEIGSLLPSSLDSGIHPAAVDTSLGMADMGVVIGSAIVPNIPSATCASPDSTRDDTIQFTFGADPSDLNATQDVRIPGYTRVISGSYPSSDPAGCTPCGTPPPAAICDTNVTYVYEDFITIPQTTLPSFRQAFALLPDPGSLPAGSPLSGFESVTVSTGQIQSILNSQLPLNSRDIGLIVYTKKANGDTIQLHNHYFNTISPYMQNGEDSTRTSSLAGAKLYDSLVVEFTGTIESSTNDTLLFPQGIDPFFHYNFEIDINGFQSINVFMSDTTITFTQAMDTRSEDASGQAFSVQIVSATFEDNLADPDTNQLSLQVTNDLAVNIDSMVLDLINFYESTADQALGNHMVISFPLPAGSSKDTTILLDGAVISNTSGDAQPIDSLDIITRVVFETTDGVVAIAYPPPDQLSMGVGFGLTPLKIADLTGLFDISFEVSEQQQPLSLPGLAGGITFGEAILAITLENEFGITPGLGLAVKGFRGSDSIVVSLDPDSVTFEPGAAGDPTSTEIRISRDHVLKTVDSVSAIVQSFAGQDNIVDLMGLMPERVSVGGDAQISPDGLSSISAGAEIAGSWHFEIPFLLQVQTGGVEFLPPNFSKVAQLDSSTLESLVGPNGVPDNSDMLISSSINTIVRSEIGLGFELQVLASDLPYFPFYSSTEGKAVVAADLNLDGTTDTVDLNLDTLILHPVVPSMKLEIPAGTVDAQTGIVIPGLEGEGSFEYSADFNLNDPNPLTPDSTFYFSTYGVIDTFLIARLDSGSFTSVDEALTTVGITAPTVADSLYNLELSTDSRELHLIYQVSDYGELGWLVDAADHYIATKFIIKETENPALMALGGGVDITAFMEFILNSEPLFGDAQGDTTQ